MNEILNMKFNNVNKYEYLNNINNIQNEGDKYYKLFINKYNIDNLLLSCKNYHIILNVIAWGVYTLTEKDNNLPIKKDIFINSLLNYNELLGKYLDLTFFNQKKIIYTQKEEDIYILMININNIINKIDDDNENAKNNLINIMNTLTILHNYNNRSLNFVKDLLITYPSEYKIHLLIGTIYKNLNDYNNSIYHLKLCLHLIEYNNNIDNTRFIIYDFLSTIYIHLKKYDLSLFYLNKALKINSNNVDILNKFGVVYNNLKRGDIALVYYNKGLDIINKINDPNKQNYKIDYQASFNLNIGDVYSHMGHTQMALEKYNKSLEYKPIFQTYQNILLESLNLFHTFNNKLEIFEKHKLIQKYFNDFNKFTFNKELFNLPKINIGFISADLVQHPVSHFINSFFKLHNKNLFNVICYSESVLYHCYDCTVKVISNLDKYKAANMIYEDKIHILFDLSGHTGFNRIEIFTLKPAPIQITYIGYPFTTGLEQMDYRITDNICDDPIISQKYYTEKLLFLDNCFLCYNPLVDVLPFIKECPIIKNNFLTLGFYNRLNKLSSISINLINNILLKYKNVQIIFKTKGLNNDKMVKEVLSKFDKSIHDRIILKKSNNTLDDYYDNYNYIDVLLDSYPYSGTTTTCDTLIMGTPMITFYDNINYYHPSNVSTSIILNTSKTLDYMICYNLDEIYSKIEFYLNQSSDYWINIKKHIRNLFLSGNITNETKYINNLQSLLLNVYNKHKNTF
jgi:predicted O-linked N-acetylglucosamine transferase (SPINDLY family)